VRIEDLYFGIDSASRRASDGELMQIDKAEFKLLVLIIVLPPDGCSRTLRGWNENWPRARPQTFSHAKVGPRYHRPAIFGGAPAT
jgi:hypothetical protein